MSDHPACSRTLTNSASDISPSWSRSNSSIIACLSLGRSATVLSLHMMSTYSSSSSSGSCNSFATLRKLRIEILPVPSSSKSRNAFLTSSKGSLDNILSVTIAQNQLKQMERPGKEAAYWVWWIHQIPFYLIHAYLDLVWFWALLLSLDQNLMPASLLWVHGNLSPTHATMLY